MPTQLTPRWANPYPQNGDVPSIPAHIQALAVALDDVAKDDQGVLASRPTSTAGTPGKRGRYYFATDTIQLFRDNGTGWDEIQIGPITSADIADGTIATADLANGAVNLAKTGAGDNGLGRGSFAAWKSGAYTLVHNASNNIAAQNELYDPSNWYDVANGRFQPVGVAGWWRVGGLIMTSTATFAAGDYLQFVVRRFDGAATTREIILDQNKVGVAVTAGGVYELVARGQGRVFLDGVDDYITFEAFFNRPAGNLALVTGSKDVCYVYADLANKTA